MPKKRGKKVSAKKVKTNKMNIPAFKVEDVKFAEQEVRPPRSGEGPAVGI